MNVRVAITGAIPLLFSACGSGGPGATPSLRVSPPASTVTAGITAGAGFTATLTGPSETVSWSLSPAGAGVLSTPTGSTTSYTAPASAASGTTVTLTATAGGLTANATITIQPAGSTTSGVTAITAGFGHSCALVSGGVQCWGGDGYGNLGNNSTTVTPTPVPVPVAGLASGSGVTAISAGLYHTCAVVNGGVQCWGESINDNLGNNSTQSNVPVVVSGLASGSGVTALAAGWYHTCAVVNGGVQCWGANRWGQLGNNSTTESHVPVPVSGLPSGSGVTAIAAGLDYTCAVVDGGVQCWGDNSGGGLGNNSTTQSSVPLPVSGLASGSGVTAVAAGYAHTCAVVSGGVQCWGDNTFGALGNNSTTQSNVPVPVAGLASGSGVTAIGAGTSHTCAVVNGGVQCWGSDQHGQLGNNSTTESNVPVAVSGLASCTNVTAIGAGEFHTCAVVNGGVECWGQNESGELGDNSVTEGTVPVVVSGLPP
jgi:alpha-tubulin suppressor-like RCC1 family protein